GTLGGTGTVVLTYTGGVLTNESQEPALNVHDGVQLTIGPGVTVRSGLGLIGGAFSPSLVNAGTVVNQGTISSEVATRTLTFRAQSFTNQGTLTIADGALLSVAGSTFRQTAGSTTVRVNSVLSAANPFLLDGGTLAGTGSVSANVANSAGQVSPGV